MNTQTVHYTSMSLNICDTTSIHKVPDSNLKQEKYKIKNFEK